MKSHFVLHVTLSSNRATDTRSGVVPIPQIRALPKLPRSFPTRPPASAGRLVPERRSAHVQKNTGPPSMPGAELEALPDSQTYLPYHLSPLVLAFLPFTEGPSRGNGLIPPPGSVPVWLWVPDSNSFPLSCSPSPGTPSCPPSLATSGQLSISSLPPAPATRPDPNGTESKHSQQALGHGHHHGFRESSGQQHPRSLHRGINTPTCLNQPPA